MRSCPDTDIDPCNHGVVKCAGLMQENKCRHHIGREKKEILSIKPVELLNIPKLVML